MNYSVTNGPTAPRDSGDLRVLSSVLHLRSRNVRPIVRDVRRLRESYGTAGRLPTPADHARQTAPNRSWRRAYSGMPSFLICATHDLTRSSDISGWLSSSQARPMNLPPETDLDSVKS